MCVFFFFVKKKKQTKRRKIPRKEPFSIRSFPATNWAISASIASTALCPLLVTAAMDEEEEEVEEASIGSN